MKKSERVAGSKGGERRRGTGRPTAHDEGTANASVYID